MELTSKESAIDSCILLRIILRDNPSQYQQATSLLLSGTEFYVDDVVIMEAVYVLTKEGMSRTSILDNLITLLDNPMLDYDRQFYSGVFERYDTHPSLSFDDCVLEARIAMKRKEPLWTFDKKFAHQSTSAKLLSSSEEAA